MDKLAPVEFPIHEVLRARWSPRALSSRSLEPEVLRSLFEAARWAPSSANEQPWHFVVARREDPAAFAKMVDCLASGNQRWAATAPVLVLAVTRLGFARSGAANRHAFHDLGLALASMLFEATSRGLATHCMAGFDVEKARAAFVVPAGFEPVTLMAVGFPGDVNALPEDLRARETAPRQRHRTVEFVFEGTWGHAAAFGTGTPPEA